MISPTGYHSGEKTKEEEKPVDKIYLDSTEAKKVLKRKKKVDQKCQ